MINNTVSKETSNTKERVPIHLKYLLTIEEASAYFHIGQTKLREIVARNNNADFVLWNNTRALIKKNKFENYIDSVYEI